MQSLGGPDEPWQEEAAARLHVEPSAAEDEADFRLVARHADVAGQRHGHADADRAAVDGGDDGLVAPVHGERGLATAVSVGIVRGIHPVLGVEVHAGAEHFVGGVARGQDDASHAGVHGERVKRGDEGLRELVCEAIAVRWAMELDDNDRRHRC